MSKFDTSMGCSYGDYDCENCSSLDEDTVCTYKLQKNNIRHYQQNEGGINDR